MALKKKPEPPENAGRWMVSYADFMTLLFAVFVVLYGFAMSAQNDISSMVQGLIQSFTEVGLVTENSATPGQAEILLSQLVNENPVDATTTLTSPEIKPIHSEVAGAGGVLDFGASNNSMMNRDNDSSKDDNNGSGAENTDAISDSSGENIMGAPLDSLREDISNALEELQDSGLVSISQNQSWLTIDLNDALVFAPESASILNRAKPILEKIAETLKPITNYVRVRGYTDNVIIHDEVYDSNWELSSARSISVIKNLSEMEIDPHRLGVEAYAQYAPFVSNFTERGRARNRCVTIAVSKYSMRPSKLEVLPDEIEMSKEVSKTMSSQDLSNIEVMRLPDGRIKMYSRDDKTVKEKSENKSSETVDSDAKSSSDNK